MLALSMMYLFPLCIVVCKTSSFAATVGQVQFHMELLDQSSKLHMSELNEDDKREPDKSEGCCAVPCCRSEREAAYAHKLHSCGPGSCVGSVHRAGLPGRHGRRHQTGRSIALDQGHSHSAAFLPFLPTSDNHSSLSVLLNTQCTTVDRSALPLCLSVSS